MVVKVWWYGHPLLTPESQDIALLPLEINRITGFNLESSRGAFRHRVQFRPDRVDLAWIDIRIRKKVHGRAALSITVKAYTESFRFVWRQRNTCQLTPPSRKVVLVPLKSFLSYRRNQA